MKSYSRFLFLAFIFGSIIYSGCAKSIKDDPSLKFQKKNFTKAYDSTAANAENYVHIKIDYVEFTEAATSVAKDSLN